MRQIVAAVLVFVIGIETSGVVVVAAAFDVVVVVIVVIVGAFVFGSSMIQDVLEFSNDYHGQISYFR